jgi:DNA-binding NtrC family response regulator
MSDIQRSIHNEDNNIFGSRITQTNAILIVDDDEDILDGYQFIFDCEGFQNYTACTPNEAMKLVRENLINTVILDYMMPTITGDELAEKMREIDPSIKVVIISGHNNAEAVFRARNIKIEGVLMKPVKPDDLIGLIRSITSENT